MVRKHNPGGHLGILAYPDMVHNRYDSKSYEFRRIYSPDDRVFIHLLLDPEDLRQQAIFRTLCPRARQCHRPADAHIQYAGEYESATVLDLGNIDIADWRDHYRL